MEKTQAMLPTTITNNYTGTNIAKWTFYAITVMTIVRSLIHMFAQDGGAQSIAHIPIDTFGENGEATVILMFALWGSSQLMMGLVYVVAIFKYLTLIPFLYLLIFFEYSFRVYFSIVKPMEATDTPPGKILDYVMIPLSVIMLYLSTHAYKDSSSSNDHHTHLVNRDCCLTQC
jgi:hypothetical protein